MSDFGNAGPAGPIDQSFVARLRAQGDVHEDEDVSVLFDRLVFVQGARGYRFGADSVVLARYAAGTSPGARNVLDIGTGCGVVGILLADEMPQATVFAVELQYMMADRAMRNTAINELCGRVLVWEGDIANFAIVAPQRSYDLVISNPPFYREGSGRVNPDGERAIARHEIRLDMKGLLAAIETLLAPDGHAVILYPAERFDECVAALAGFGLRVRTVVPLMHAPDQPVESYIIDIIRFDDGQADGAPEIAAPLFLNRSSE